MKREFLLNLQVGEQSLPKEVIDAIMAENGRDIQKAKAAFADYDDMKAQLADLQRSAQEAENRREAAKTWEEKYNQAVQTHAQQLSQMAFDHDLETAIGKAGGRSQKAIRALLDLDALRQSEDQPHAMEQALEALKAASGYLFENPTPPPYAWGTGAYQGTYQAAPTSLAGALRERFERK